MPEEKRVYIDEVGVDKCLVRERVRAPRGVKVEDVQRGRKFQRMNVVAAKIGIHIVASKCYAQTTTSHFSSNGFIPHF